MAKDGNMAQQGGLTYQVDKHGTVADAEYREREVDDPGDGLRFAALDALVRVRKVLSEGPTDKDDLMLARIGMGMIKAWAQYEQTKSARAALGWSIAKGIADNKGELRRYVELTEPQHPMAKSRPLPTWAGKK